MRTVAMSTALVFGLLGPLEAAAAPPEQPSVQRPSKATAAQPSESASTPAGPAPVEPAPTEPAPAPPDPEASPTEADPADEFWEPEPEPASLPSYDAELPSYDEAPIDPLADPDLGFVAPPEPEPEQIPRSGYGRVAVGSILLGGGAVLTGISAGMIVADIDALAWIPGAVVGAGAITAGALSILTGKLRQKKYRAWAEPYGGERAVPRSGAGLTAAGLTCVIAGGAGLTIGGLSLTVQDTDDLPYGEVMMSLAAVSLVTGATLMAYGGKRKKEFQRWRMHSVTPSFSLLPGSSQRLAGISLGLIGRF